MKAPTQEGLLGYLGRVAELSVADLVTRASGDIEQVLDDAVELQRKGLVAVEGDPELLSSYKTKVTKLRKTGKTEGEQRSLLMRDLDENADQTRLSLTPQGFNLAQGGPRWK